MARKKKQPHLFEYKNEYRTWYCLLYRPEDYTSATVDRKLYMTERKVGHCSATAYRFRTPEDRFLFLLNFGLIVE